MFTVGMPETGAAPAFATTGPQGHRSRMRTRLLTGSPGGLADYELLEMLLFFSIPRRDTKPLAKAVINHFGDLYRALIGSPAELRRAGLDSASVGAVALVRESARRLARAQAVSRPLLGDMAQLMNYLDPPARLLRPAHCAVLFLNNRNQLLDDVAFPGDGDPATIAQAVARQALRIHASALMLASFRPGLLAEPDARDRTLTRRIAAVASALSLTLHDHVVFGADGHNSLKRRGLL